ncbi:hypothetical protein PLESTM_001732900 [Pleodorina starrii]|nr:hypothetical protein PLESTM_001732900 [Pleodorina starrii]
MAPPAVRASLSSVPSQRQQQQQQIDAAEYYGLYKTARTLARSYQAVAHQKDDQVKALTREMEELKLKLQHMEAQQQWLTAGFHDPSSSALAPSQPAAQSLPARTSAPAACQSLTRSAAIFMQAANNATARQPHLQQNSRALAAVAAASGPAVGANPMRQSVDVNLLISSQMRSLRNLQHAEHPQAPAPPPMAMPAYPEVPMPAPVLAPAPSAAAGMFSRSARSARASGEVWSARFSEPPQPHYPASGITAEDGAEDGADVADTSGKPAKKAAKEGKGTITKAFKKLMSKSWRSSRDDHPARQDAASTAAAVANGGGAAAVAAAINADLFSGAPFQHQQHHTQYLRRPGASGSGGGAAFPELEYYDPAAPSAMAAFEEGLMMDPPPLALPPPPPVAPRPFEPPPPLAAPALPAGHATLSVTLPSSYLLGAPSSKDQLALAAQRQEAARQQQLLLLQHQQQQAQQQLLLLQQSQQQQLALQQQQQAAAAAAATMQLQQQQKQEAGQNAPGQGAPVPPARRALQYQGSVGRSAAHNLNTADIALLRHGQGGQAGQGLQGPSATTAANINTANINTAGVDAARLRRLQQQQQQAVAVTAAGGFVAGAASPANVPAGRNKDAAGAAAASSEGSGAWTALKGLTQIAHRLKNGKPGAALRRSHDGVLGGAGAAAPPAVVAPGRGGGVVSGLVNSGVSVHQSWSSDGMAAHHAESTAAPLPQRSSAPSAAARAAVSASLSSLNIRAAAAHLGALPPRPTGRAAAGFLPAPHSATTASGGAVAAHVPEQEYAAAAAQPPPAMSFTTSTGAVHFPHPVPAGAHAAVEVAAAAAASSANAASVRPEAAFSGARPVAAPQPEAPAPAKVNACAAAAAAPRPKAKSVAADAVSSSADLESILCRLKTPSVLLTATAAARLAATVQSEPPPPPPGSCRTTLDDVGAAAGTTAGHMSMLTADEAVQTETPGKLAAAEEVDALYDELDEASAMQATQPVAAAASGAGAASSEDDTVLRRDLRRSVGVGWRAKALGFKNAAPSPAFHEKTLSHEKAMALPRTSITAGAPREHPTPSPGQSQCVALVEAALAATPNRTSASRAQYQAIAASYDPTDAADATTPSAPPLQLVSSRTPTRSISAVSAAAASAATAAAAAAVAFLPMDSPRGAAPPSSPTAAAAAEEEDIYGTPFRSPEPHHHHYQHEHAQRQQHAEAAALWRSSSPRVRASARAVAHDGIRSPSPIK